MQTPSLTVIRLFLAALALCALLLPADSVAQTAGKKQTYRVALLGDTFFTNPGLGRKQTTDGRIDLMVTLQKAPLEFKNFSETGLETVDATEKLKDILTWRPDVVVVNVGTQDIINKVQKKYIFSNLSKILYNLTRYDVRVLFYGVERPANLYNVFDFNTELADRYMTSVDEMFSDIARMYNVVYRPPLTDVFEGNPYYYMPDRVHPNNRGTERMVAQMLRDIALILHHFNDPDMLHNLATNSPQTIALIGETLFSTFSGYEDISFANLLRNHVIVERGKANVVIDNYSSTRLGAGIVTLDDAITTRVIKNRSKAAIVQLGVSDMVETNRIAKVIARDIGKVVGMLKSNNVVPLLVGAKRLDTGTKRMLPSRMSEFRVIYKFLGERLQIPYIEDITAVVPGYKIGSRKNIPDKESMKKIVQVIWKGLEPVIIEMEKEERKDFAEKMNLASSKELQR